MSGYPPSMPRPALANAAASPPAQPDLARNAARRRDKIALLFAIPVILYGLFFPIFRPMGAGPLIIALACAGVCAMQARQVYVSRAYLGFLAISLLYLGLSLLRVLPPAWTTLFDAEGALRQWLWVLAVPLLITAYTTTFRVIGRVIIRRALIFAIALYGIYFVAATFGDASFDGRLYDVSNSTLPIVLCLVIFLFRQQRSTVVDLALIGAFFAFTESSSQQMLAICLFAIRIWPRPQWIITALALSILAFLVFAPLNPMLMLEIDSNVGVRSVMWRDAAVAVFETNGVGVGYGTEYISNRFYAIGRPDWYIASQHEGDALFMSTHSSIYDVLMRLGVGGMALFLAWFVPLLRIPARLAQEDKRIYTALCCGFLIYTSFNPGLVAFMVVFGSCTLLGWITFLRQVSHSRSAAAHG